MADELKPILYGKTIKVKLADDNYYTMREPNIDSLESLDFDPSRVNDIKTIRKVAWTLLKEDNPSLDENLFGRLVTMSMMLEGSEFMKAIVYTLGTGGKEKNE